MEQFGVAEIAARGTVRLSNAAIGWNADRRLSSGGRMDCRSNGTLAAPARQEELKRRERCPGSDDSEPPICDV
jgi:hypothetical protein